MHVSLVQMGRSDVWTLCIRRVQIIRFDCQSRFGCRLFSFRRMLPVMNIRDCHHRTTPSPQPPCLNTLGADTGSCRGTTDTLSPHCLSRTRAKPSKGGDAKPPVLDTRRRVSDSGVAAERCSQRTIGVKYEQRIAPHIRATHQRRFPCQTTYPDESSARQDCLCLHVLWSVCYARSLLVPSASFHIVCLATTASYIPCTCRPRKRCQSVAHHLRNSRDFRASRYPVRLPTQCVGSRRGEAALLHQQQTTLGKL
jgi:hypothetical protein